MGTGLGQAAGWGLDLSDFLYRHGCAATARWESPITRIEKGRAQVDSLLRQVEAVRIAAEVRKEVIERAERDMEQALDQ